MKEKQIINLIESTRALYQTQKDIALRDLKKDMSKMSAQQIANEMIFIQEMESRAYCLKLLLEDIMGD